MGYMDYNDSEDDGEWAIIRGHNKGDVANTLSGGSLVKASSIRQSFIQYFQRQGHQWVQSSSLVPAGDRTLLFTNAGMVQFKDVFLGLETREYRRAVSAQKCMRAGGKHNDLDQVGRTARHQTFFEMMGNFSFGDYFKAEAIRLAWEFLTRELAIDRDRLWISVFESDDEAVQLWLQVAGIAPERIVRLGERENFWSMGETGPCGPSSEIFVDRGEAYSCGPNCGLGQCDCDRLQEIWNLVFMQYNRDPDGNLTPLPRPCIDTGMGLERVAAYLQGVDSTFDTDLLRPLVERVESLSGRLYDRGEAGMAFRVIADHARAVTFLLADGVTFSNLGRGYVMRRILRRAVRFGRLLGFERPFLHELVPVVTSLMSDAYPELIARQATIGEQIRQEEERFLSTLSAGMQVLNDKLRLLRAGDTLSGADAFLLYDTYGFPLDLTRDHAQELGVRVAEAEFERLMAEQRERARKTRQYLDVSLPVKPPATFLGYDTLELEHVVVGEVVIDGDPVNSLEAGEAGYVWLSETPFYAEGGGQVGDQGELAGADGARFSVHEVVRVNGSTWHFGTVTVGRLERGQPVLASVNRDWRANCRRNHTATHLLHAALRQVLGESVRQTGSLVAPDRLRFDFSYGGPLTSETIAQLEDLVNRWIQDDRPVNTVEKPREQALAEGAVAFFGDKYGDRVRVVTVRGASQELCGGTHVARSGEIGPFVIMQESSVGAGSRRIEALTGAAAVQQLKAWRDRETELTRLLKVGGDQVVDKIQDLLAESRRRGSRIEELETENRAARGRSLVERAEICNGFRLVVAAVEPPTGVDGLRHWVDGLKSAVDVAVLASGSSQQAALVVFLSQPLRERGLDAARLVKGWAPMIGGGGGGRADFAQAGGRRGDQIRPLLDAARRDLWEELEKMPATLGKG